MRALRTKTNVQAPDSDYTFGRIKDDPGDNTGTPVNELLYGDMHQFFEKLMLDAGLAANGLPEQAYTGFQLNQALSKLFLQKKIIPFGTGTPAGAWNMDTTTLISVSHGIAGGSDKIKIVHARVAPNTGSPFTNLLSQSVGGLMGGGINWDSSNIDIYRTTGGIFDTAGYNAASGLIIIEYDLS